MACRSRHRLGQQRRSRCRAVEQATAEGLWSLNEMSGFGHNLDCLRPSEAQAAVVKHVWSATARDATTAPPPGAEAALRLAEVSWPRSAGAVTLAPLLPEADRLLLSEGGERLHLNAKEWQMRAGVEGLLRPYWDETLRRDRATYLAFARELLLRKMVSLRRARRHAAGIFFVRKNSGRLRMVVDARVTNQALHRPPSAHLASTLAVAEVTSSDGSPVPVCFSRQDIADCYYVPVPPTGGVGAVVRTAAAGSSELLSIGVHADLVPGPGFWYPCLAVLPMVFFGRFTGLRQLTGGCLQLQAPAGLKTNGSTVSSCSCMTRGGRST